MEAFVTASTDSSNISLQYILRVVISVSHLFLSWLLIQSFNTKGVIIANCISMMVRIVCSVWFIRLFSRSKQLDNQNLVSDIAFSVSPGFFPIVSLIAAFFITFLSERLTGSNLPSPSLLLVFCHLLIGLVCFLAVLFVFYKSQRETLDSLKKARVE